jgi:hypothetical protein
MIIKPKTEPSSGLEMAFLKKPTSLILSSLEAI